MALAIVSFRSSWRTVWKSSVHVWAWQVGAKGAGKSIWDPDESVQLLHVISVTGKVKNKMSGCYSVSP